MARKPFRVMEQLENEKEKIYQVPQNNHAEITSLIISNVGSEVEEITIEMDKKSFPGNMEIPANDMVPVPLKNSPIKLNEGEKIKGMGTGPSASASVSLFEGDDDKGFDIELEEEGFFGNYYDIEIVDNSGELDVNLSAQLDDQRLMVQLGTDEDGNVLGEIEDGEYTSSFEEPINLVDSSIVSDTVSIYQYATQPDEVFVSDYDTPVDLEYENLQENTVEVTNIDGTGNYDEGDDYLIDYENGTIEVIAEGNMVDNNEYLISYDYFREFMEDQDYNVLYEEGNFEVLFNTVTGENFVAVVNVDDEEFMSNYNTYVNLEYENIEFDSETVTNTDGTGEFERGTDYEMNYVDGEIMVLDDGSMTDEANYLISYTVEYIELENTNIRPDSEVIESADGTFSFTEGEDYEIDHDLGRLNIISSEMAGEDCTADYEYSNMQNNETTYADLQYTQNFAYNIVDLINELEEFNSTLHGSGEGVITEGITKEFTGGKSSNINVHIAGTEVEVE